MKPKVLLITTGGTVSMQRNPEGSLSPFEDAGLLVKKIPELNQLAEIDMLPVANIDSSNIQPSLWVTLGEAIYRRMNDYDGFVVTHGTDTLCYSAAALSFFIQELSKPVIITGAQLPLEDVGSDSRMNLINAFRVAISDIAEVAVVFGSLVIKGTRARKSSVFDMQAITSDNAIPLGSIGLFIKYSPWKQARGRRKPLFQPFLNENVALVHVYPGFKPEILAHLASSHDGIVLAGFGAGNIPTAQKSLIPVIRSATEKKTPVVVCTQCIVGSTQMELYQVGREALEAGAIPAMDMTPETSLVKLMWVLGQTTDPAAVDSMMQKSFVGELHEML
jgi:L-asparaginase